MHAAALPDIEIEQDIRASRDLIWQCCASADGIARWQADEAEGEARVGGSLTLYWTAFSAAVHLDVVDVVPRERIVMRNGSTRVEIQLTDTGVRLLHTGLDDGDELEGLRSSWQIALAQLAHSVERHPGRERRVAWMVQELPLTVESAHAFFSDATCLGLWLCSRGSVGDAGDPYELVLKNDTIARGRVLANVPGRDLALSVESHGSGVLTMRTLPAPGSADTRLVSLVWSEWGPPSMRAQALVDQLAASLDALAHCLERGGSA